MFSKEEVDQNGFQEHLLCIPKKLLPGETVPRVHWISNFHALNKALNQNVYPIPQIADILARCTGYEFLSKIDLSMQYHTFELDDQSKELTTIATPLVCTVIGNYLWELALLQTLLKKS